MSEALTVKPGYVSSIPVAYKVTGDTRLPQSSSDLYMGSLAHKRRSPSPRTN